MYIAYRSPTESFGLNMETTALVDYNMVTTDATVRNIQR